MINKYCAGLTPKYAGPILNLIKTEACQKAKKNYEYIWINSILPMPLRGL